MFSQILFKLPQHLFLHQKVSGETFLPPQVLFMPPQHFFIYQKVTGETLFPSQVLFMPPQHFFLQKKYLETPFCPPRYFKHSSTNFLTRKTYPLTKQGRSHERPHLFSSIQLRLHLTLLHTFVKSKPECVLLFRN